MRGIDTLDLPTGEYRVRPSETLRNWDGRLRDLLSGDRDALDGMDEYHKYTVERGGRPALEILQKRLRGETEFVVSIPTVRDVYLFRTPDGTLQFVLDTRSEESRRHYAVEDPRNGETLATVERSGALLGDWQLVDPNGSVRATADRQRSLGDLFSSSRRYSVVAPDGEEVARLDYGRGSGSLTDMALSEMTVSCRRSSLPTELRLAFAFAVFDRINESSSSSSGGGGGGID